MLIMIVGKSRYIARVGKNVVVKLKDTTVLSGIIADIRVGQIDLKVGTKNGRGEVKTISMDNIIYMKDIDRAGTPGVVPVVCEELKDKDNSFVRALDKFLRLGMNIAYCGASSKGKDLNCGGKITCIVSGDEEHIKANMHFVGQMYKRVWGVSRDNEFSPEQVKLFEEMLSKLNGKQKLDIVTVIYKNGQITDLYLKLY